MEEEKKTTWECLIDIIGMLGNNHKVVSEKLEITEDELDCYVQQKCQFSKELATKVLKLFIKLEDNPSMWVGEPTDAMEVAERLELMRDVVFVEGDRRSTATRYPVA